jgi:hypoxanthine phosphoribosyltransferase
LMIINPLITSEEISRRVSEMGKEIFDKTRSPITLIAILKGSICFAADLLRSIDGEVRIGFISVSSYSGTESQNIRLHGMDLEDVMGRDIVVVEDIIDSGKTMEYICGKLSELSPKSVKICTLLNKPLNRKNTLEIDYVGFEIEDHFVVGYGLDIDQKYRNLPYIGYVDTPN